MRGGDDSRESMRPLLDGIDLECKIVDLGNACWTYKQVLWCKGITHDSSAAEEVIAH